MINKNYVMEETLSIHYNEKYFSWQSSIGEFGGWANITKFKAYISMTDDVLDFGCGGGFLLSNLQCRKKVGIEVNPKAAEAAKDNGIEVYQKVKDVPDEYVDVVISNNALEHTHHPLQILKDLYPKLKKKGKIIFVVPCESISNAYRPNDINQHLYSWSPMCIGNLFVEAGYLLLESKPYIHKWPPQYRLIARFGGRRLFEYACKFYGKLDRSWFQVKVIAERANE